MHAYYDTFIIHKLMKTGGISVLPKHLNNKRLSLGFFETDFDKYLNISFLKFSILTNMFFKF